MALSKRPSGKAGASQQQAEVHSRAMRTATGTKRLNAPVPADLYRRIQQQALDEGRSVAEITRELWARYLGVGDSDIE